MGQRPRPAAVPSLDVDPDDLDDAGAVRGCRCGACQARRAVEVVERRRRYAPRLTLGIGFDPLAWARQNQF